MNDDSMIVHMHDDNGDEKDGMEKEEEEEEEEEEDDDDDSESFYEPWQCLSDREIGTATTHIVIMFNYRNTTHYLCDYGTQSNICTSFYKSMPSYLIKHTFLFDMTL